MYALTYAGHMAYLANSSIVEYATPDNIKLVYILTFCVQTSSIPGKSLQLHSLTDEVQKFFKCTATTL